MPKISIAFSIGVTLAFSTVAGAAPSSMSVPLTEPEPKTYFCDVPKDHWAYQVVQRLNTFGLLGANSAHRVQRNAPMSRHEFAVLLGSLVPPTQAKLPLDDEKVLSAIVQNLVQDRNPSPSSQTQQIGADILRALGSEFRDELQRLGFNYRNNGCPTILLESETFKGSAERQVSHLTVSWSR